MLDWNVVLNVREGGFGRAFEVLGAMGRVGKTGFYNVLVVQVEDTGRLLDALLALLHEDPGALWFVSRLVPVTKAFSFQSVGEFEEKAKEAVSTWVSALEGKGFHVRMHRRGFKGRLSGLDEERILDGYLLDVLKAMGTPGRIDFDDPGAVITVETVGQRAGLSIWSREDLERYPFIRPD